jgi:hypothetical protein
VCLALYLIVDRLLPPVETDSLVVAPLHRRRWGWPAVDGGFVYRFGPPGCACSLLRDGEEDVTNEDRDRQLAAAEEYLDDVCSSGSVTALVSWMGDERKEATPATATPSSFRDIDFDKAWERPMKVAITAPSRD